MWLERGCFRRPLMPLIDLCINVASTMEEVYGAEGTDQSNNEEEGGQGLRSHSYTPRATAAVTESSWPHG